MGNAEAESGSTAADSGVDAQVDGDYRRQQQRSRRQRGPMVPSAVMKKNKVPTKDSRVAPAAN